MSRRAARRQDGGAGASGLPSRWRARIAEALDLPAELLLDLPRLTVVVPLQLVVENHRGLAEFLPERVVVSTSTGRIEIRGEDLRVGAVRAGEIIVTGRLRAVSFAEGEA